MSFAAGTSSSLEVRDTEASRVRERQRSKSEGEYSYDVGTSLQDHLVSPTVRFQSSIPELTPGK